jgi:hypothetical protein
MVYGRKCARGCTNIFKVKGPQGTAIPNEPKQKTISKGDYNT